MKTKDIKVGGHYLAKVSGNIVTVKVISINEREGNKYRRGGTGFTCLNLRTGKTVGFRSAARFRAEAKQGPDPTPAPTAARTSAPAMTPSPDSPKAAPATNGASKPAVRVSFVYDEDTRKWDPLVFGAESDLEARQAFSAVVLTCQLLDPALLNLTQVGLGPQRNSYRIFPAVRQG